MTMELIDKYVTRKQLHGHYPTANEVIDYLVKRGLERETAHARFWRWSRKGYVSSYYDGDGERHFLIDRNVLMTFTETYHIKFTIKL